MDFNHVLHKKKLLLRYRGQSQYLLDGKFDILFNEDGSISLDIDGYDKIDQTFKAEYGDGAGDYQD